MHGAFCCVDVNISCDHRLLRLNWSRSNRFGCTERRDGNDMPCQIRRNIMYTLGIYSIRNIIARGDALHSILLLQHVHRETPSPQIFCDRILERAPIGGEGMRPPQFR